MVIKKIKWVILDILKYFKIVLTFLNWLVLKISGDKANSSFSFRYFSTFLSQSKHACHHLGVCLLNGDGRANT